MARNTWYRLDNVGKFYSAQAGSSAQTVFRFSATLVDEVDESVLQRAVEKTAKVFPSFNVCLRSGMFWHYLEQVSEPPAVGPENLPICFGLHVDVKSVLFRVSYYRDRINFEVSHIVSDGRGALTFFKALLYTYIRERYHVEGIRIEYDGSDRQKSENSFDKYYEREKAASTHVGRGKTAETRKPATYRLTGRRDKADPTYMEYHLSSQSVRDLARSYGVSVTSLVIASIMCAVRPEMSHRNRHRVINIGIPVDLRQMFESTTTKNFFGLTSVSYTPEENESVREVSVKVHAQLKAATETESLKPRMNRMIGFEKNPFLRFAPLFVKDWGLDKLDRWAARDITTTVSNLSQISIDERIAPFIRDINILTSTTGLNFTMCSFGDDLSIGIATVYSDLEVIKNFCRFFSSQGIEGILNINKTETPAKSLGGQTLSYDGLYPPNTDVGEGGRSQQ